MKRLLIGYRNLPELSVILKFIYIIIEPYCISHRKHVPHFYEYGVNRWLVVNARVLPT